MASKLKDEALEMVDDLAQKAEDTKDEVVSRVRDTASRAGAKAKDMAADVSSRAARVRRDAEDALEEAGEALSETGARLSRRLRSGVDSAIESVRDSRTGEVAREVHSMAQRNPGLFMAGAALFGFALAHLMRAGRESGRNRR